MFKEQQKVWKPTSTNVKENEQMSSLAEVCVYGAQSALKYGLNGRNN